MNDTLYLKYRPSTFSGLDSRSVRESLKKVVASGKIPHAFLFSGPRGTGKTSAARLIAKILNCEKKGKEPCNKCEQCASIANGTNLDVIEMDAASNRGIDDIRNLRDAVKLSPAKAAKKVYIIDEAHMLTTEAANALLKTLEEPPSHVYFILATTNPEKLIETIRSRTTNIVFKKATVEEAVNSLRKVADGEKIKAKEDTLIQIAKSAGGSFRDATKIFEQLISESVISDEEKVKEFLFSKKALSSDDFIRGILEKDAKGLLIKIESFVSSGGMVERLIKDVVEELRLSFLAKEGLGEDPTPGLSQKEVMRLIALFSGAYSQLKDAVLEQIPLELAVVEWSKSDGGQESGGEETGSEGTGGAKDVKEVPGKEDKGPKEPVRAEAVEAVHRKRDLPASSSLDNFSESTWRDILSRVKPVNTSIEALLRAARPVGYDGKTLTLGVFYRFHKERLEDSHHRRILEEVVAGVMGGPVRVVCTLSEPPVRKVEVKPPKETVLTEGGDEDIIKVAEEIFGNN